MLVLKKIQKLRKAKKISQKQMAEALNISQPGYQKIEQGTNVLSIERFLEICRILEIESYNVLLPDVNGNRAEKIQLIVMSGSAAFKEINTNARYCLKFTSELVEKIKSKKLEIEEIVEEIHFLDRYLEIITRVSVSKQYNLKSVLDLIEQLD